MITARYLVRRFYLCHSHGESPMRRIVGLIIGLLIVLLGLSFALLNANPVELEFYVRKFTMPLSLLLVLVLIVGAMLGVLASLSMLVSRRRELSRLRRRLSETEKELDELRRLPLKDQP